MKLQQDEDMSASIAAAGPVSSQSSLRQPRATASAASNIDKPDKKSDNVSNTRPSVVDHIYAYAKTVLMAFNDSFSAVTSAISALVV